jgi:carboxypeptidase Q
MQHHLLRSAVALLLVGSSLPAQGDPDTIERILVEGKEHSQVWETLRVLSEDIGPRLTGSTRAREANEWARDEFARLGLSNAHLEEWGTFPLGFDRGPSHLRLLTPDERELEFTAPSWSPGTDGPLRARVFRLPRSMAELEEIGFEFEGSLVLCPPRERPNVNPAGDEAARAAEEERQAIDEALAELGIAGRIISARGELVLTGAARGWRQLSIDALPTTIEIEIRQSDHDLMAEALDAFEDVTVEVDLQHRFLPGPVSCANTIAEIRGTELPDEIVVVSGHLDSWDGPGSQGAQDNGTGSAVTIEAARILMAAGAKPRRTIRFALWTGEEQGLFGSAGHVANLSEEERARVSVCLVDDGGTNYQGGLVCLETQKEMLDRAIAPVQAAFPELPMENTVVEHLPRFAGSDHASFNAVNIPGFFWNETGSGGREGKNYNFVHHTQHDTMRYAVPEYLVQSATCSAVVAYQLACADSLLPRDTPREDRKAPEPDPTFEVVDGPLTGTWVLILADAGIDITLVVEHARDGRLRGNTTAMGSTSWFQEGEWDEDAGEGTFEVVSEIGKIPYEVSIEDGKLKGTIQAMGSTMAVTGSRKP